MKRAITQIIGASFLEFYERANNLYDVNTILNLQYEFFDYQSVNLSIFAYSSLK